MEYRYNFKNLDPRLKILSIVRFVRAFGRGSTFVFLPLVFISVYHLSFILTGLLLGFATLLMATVQFLAGIWTDRIGRRSILVYSQIPGILAYQCGGQVLSKLQDHGCGHFRPWKPF